MAEHDEPKPGTYWERAVLERFILGGPVDLATIRVQVAALLAEVDVSTETDPCTRCGGAFPREYLWVLRGGYGPQGSWQGGYYCRDCCIATTGREPEVSA